jgi:hypothetical protein
MYLHNHKLIRTIDDWFQFAPPKRGVLQWKDFRSAKELARAWTCNGEPAPPQVFLRVLQNMFGPELSVTEPEAAISFDDIPSEKRNSDLLVFYTNSREMGICFTQVCPTGCGFPGFSTSGWRIFSKGTGSIITAC